MRQTVLLLVGMLTAAVMPTAVAGPKTVAGTPRTKAGTPQKKIVIPFDFESRFDEGVYGRKVGGLIWKKLEREGRSIIPESMTDVRDVCERIKFHPGPKTSLAKMGHVLREEFEGDIAVWGSVERVPPHETDVYDLRIRVVDFSGPKPVVIYDRSHRTKTVSEIPHLYVKRMLAVLYHKRPEAPAGLDPAAEKRWKTAPNLLANGSFQKGRRRLDGWDPLPKFVSLVTSRKNRYLRMSFPKNIAATSGVLYYSEYFPVDEGATYRFSCRYRTSGSAVKVFIKCYDEFRDSRTGTNRNIVRKREVYRSQQNLKGEPGTWQTHTEDFTPKHPRFTPRWGRVMLYAYWPAGTVEWDDVVVKQIKPSPAASTADR